MQSDAMWMWAHDIVVWMQIIQATMLRMDHPKETHVQQHNKIIQTHFA